MASLTLADMASRTSSMADKPKAKWIKRKAEAPKAKAADKVERVAEAPVMMKRKSPLYDMKKD